MQVLRAATIWVQVIGLVYLFLGKVQSLGGCFHVLFHGLLLSSLVAEDFLFHERRLYNLVLVLLATH